MAQASAAISARARTSLPKSYDQITRLGQDEDPFGKELGKAASSGRKLDDYASAQTKHDGAVIDVQISQKAQLKQINQLNEQIMHIHDKIGKKKEELDRLGERKANTEKKWMEVHSRHQSLQIELQMKNTRASSRNQSTAQSRQKQMSLALPPDQERPDPNLSLHSSNMSQLPNIQDAPSKLGL